jgi:arginyl-tRNA synthetase
VLRLAAADMPGIDQANLANADLSGLKDGAELDVIRRIAAWPRVVEGAALSHEPHRIAFYLHDLAGDFHLLWNKGKEDPGLRFVVAEDPGITAARLALLSAIRMVIAAGLSVIGVQPVEEMR